MEFIKSGSRGPLVLLLIFNLKLFTMNDQNNLVQEPPIIESLPDAVLQEIADFCGGSALLKMRATCRAMRQRFCFTPGVPLALREPDKSGKRAELITLMASFPPFQLFSLGACDKRGGAKLVSTDLRKLAKIRVRVLGGHYQQKGKFKRICCAFQKQSEPITKRFVELDLSNTGMRAVSTALHCYWIKKLSLNNNCLTTKGCSHLARFTNLTYLNLSENPLKEIPAAIGSLTNLTCLYLAYTSVGNNPEKMEKFLSKCTLLKELCLKKCGLRTIPAGIASLTHLTKLSLASNKIGDDVDHLNVVLTACNLLRYLNVSKTGLSRIPPAIGTLPHLEWLKLSKNNLNSIIVAELRNSFSDKQIFFA